MKNLYNEFLYLPKHGKIHEKVMRVRLIILVAIVISCLAAMSITAYAYFSSNITSSANNIKAANFETNILIKDVDTDEDISVTRVNGFTQTANLVPGKTYKVSVQKIGNASTGFCTISAPGSQITEYHTQQLGIDENSATEILGISFTLKVTNPTTVCFDACWGTSADYYDYVNNGILKDSYIISGRDVIMNIVTP